MKVRKSSLELLLWFWVTSHEAHAHLAGVSCCFHGWGACSTPKGMANCTKTIACNQWLITKHPLARSSSGNEAEVCGGNGVHGFGTKEEGKSSGVTLPTWILLGLRLFSLRVPAGWEQVGWGVASLLDAAFPCTKIMLPPSVWVALSAVVNPRGSDARLRGPNFDGCGGKLEGVDGNTDVVTDKPTGCSVDDAWMSDKEGTCLN